MVVLEHPRLDRQCERTTRWGKNKAFTRSEGFQPGSNGCGMLFGLQGSSSRRESPAHVRAIKRIKTPLPYPKDDWQGAREGNPGLADGFLPPCLKDRRDVAECKRYDKLTYPRCGDVGFSKSRRQGFLKAEELISATKKVLLRVRVSPSRRKTLPGALTFNVVIHSTASGENMGSIVEEGITPPTGKAAGLRDYPMLSHNLPRQGELFSSQTGASAPVNITAVRGDSIYNRESASTLTDSAKQYHRWSRGAGQREGGDGGLHIESAECSWPDSRKFPCSTFNYQLSEPFYCTLTQRMLRCSRMFINNVMKGVIPMG